MVPEIENGKESFMSEGKQVLIVDFGGQLVQVIKRSIRELGADSVVLKPDPAGQWLLANRPKCIIFSGGPASVNDHNAPMPPEEVFQAGIPILGICYGMQVLAKRFGGFVSSGGGSKNYGRTHIIRSHHLISCQPCPYESEPVFASHGDVVLGVPQGFINTATFSSGSGMITAAMGDPVRRIWGVQYHPEAVQTTYGRELFMRFLHVAHCETDWDPHRLFRRTEEYAREIVSGKKVILAYSGGVDSSVAAALALRSSKEVLGVCIDTGGLRKGELGEIKTNASAISLPLRIIDAESYFLQALWGLEDGEKRREAFRLQYRNMFSHAVFESGADIVIQGSIAPDFIETQDAGSVIKTHHNIDAGYEHPLKGLFKYEVRELGQWLDLPEHIIKRHPFPGPGLYIRIVNHAITPDLIELLRRCRCRCGTGTKAI